MQAAELPVESSDKDDEYEELLAAFLAYMSHKEDSQAKNAALYSLMKLRSDISLRHAFKGFGISYEDALSIIAKDADVTEEEFEIQKIILAAIENLVDFSVVAEYQMIYELEDEVDEDEILAIFNKYNKRYASVENMDIEYAMGVAAQISTAKPTTILTYMTQGDERVRPWHRIYEGFSAPKSSFPHWLVPPIEHMCRCFLIEEDIVAAVKASSQDASQIPDWFNPTFKESVAFGGRIFSDEHPYFQVRGGDVDMLTEVASMIKEKIYGATGYTTSK